MILNDSLKKYFVLSLLFMALLLSSCGQTKQQQETKKLPKTPVKQRNVATKSPASSKTKKSSTETSSRVNDFSKGTVGAEPVSFACVVGNWAIGVDGDNKVLMVDGSKWEPGKASAGLAEKARAIYGKRYAEFLDNVKTYAYFPLAVATNVEDFRQGEISFRFKPIKGRIDQAAGIVFDLKPNGDYLVVRANAVEDNMVFWKYQHGKRSSVIWVRDVPTPGNQWHELKLDVNGNKIKGYLDGKLYLKHTLETTVAGKVGVWSKADSVVYFDDFSVKATKN